MITSIFTALSGMLGYQRGLNVISNNVSNMNTPGFRGSSVSFSDVFIGNPVGNVPNRQLPGEQHTGGSGVDASRTELDLRTGESQQTGGDLDLLLSGNGYFVVRDGSGHIRYTRDGSFDIVNGELVTKPQGFNVMMRDAAGQLVPLTVNGLDINPPKSTTSLTFSGTLSPGDANTPNPNPTPVEKVVDTTVFDAVGGKHTLRTVFTLDTSAPAGATTNWKVVVQEGPEQLATTDLSFSGSVVLSGVVPLSVNLKNAGPTDIRFDFSAISGINTGSNTVAVSAQDGQAAGTISTKTFDESGQLKLTYSNGQKADGPKLVLAEIRDDNGLVAVGDSLLAYAGTAPVTLREAGDDLKVQTKQLERSNVDLTTEFSELILMQRGYQAASQVVSTANDMMQQLLQLKGAR